MTNRALGRWLRLAAPLVVLATAAAAPDPTRLASPPPSPRLRLPTANVLFVDDFAHADLSRWNPDREDTWTVWRGMLRADLPDGKQVRSLAYFGDPAWTDIAVDLDVCMIRGVDKGVVVRVQGQTGLGIDLRGPGYQDVVAYVREWPMGRAPVANGNGTWNHLRVEVRGEHVRVIVNGDLKLDRRDAKKVPASGRCALPAYTGGTGQCTVYYDNVVVTALK